MCEALALIPSITKPNQKTKPTKQNKTEQKRGPERLQTLKKKIISLKC